MVLLDILARIAKRSRLELRALHVNHQLSPNAARWARFCRDACTTRGIPCRVAKVAVSRGNSIERAARVARYAALYDSPADHIVLAHNEDDQGETVFLQLLRGGGVRGLAAMPFIRRNEGGGMRAEGKRKKSLGTPHPSSLIPHPSILRPLLDVPRAEIEAYARARKLTWIDDESNEDTRYQRNWLRREILPQIAERVPGYRIVLARAARHFGEAALLLDDLARSDVGDALASGTLPVARLRGLSAARAKNAVRFLIASRGWPLPDAERLDEALRQALTGASDRRISVDLGGCELKRYAGSIHFLQKRARERADAVITWRGESEVVMPGLGGVLSMEPARGAGLSVARLQAEPVTIRARQGGERLQPDAERPRRTVKNLLQEARMPPWRRERLPLIFCGEALACVPGVAIDSRFRARRGEASILPEWREA